MAMFTGADLDLALDDTVDADDGAQQTELPAFKPKVDKSAATNIYRRGRAPDWAPAAVASAAEQQFNALASGRPTQQRRRQRSQQGVDVQKIVRTMPGAEAPLSVSPSSAAAAAGCDSDDSADERRRRARARRRRQQLEEADASLVRKVVELEPDSRGVDAHRTAVSSIGVEQDVVEKTHAIQTNDDNDDDEIAARRARIRARLKRMSAENDAHTGETDDSAVEASASSSITAQTAVVSSDGEEESSSESSGDSDSSGSEYETDSSAEDRARRKPMFVPKSQRATIAEAERLASEAEKRAEREKARELERVKETQQQVAAAVKSELEQERAALNPTIDVAGTMPDDRDDVDEEAEYAAWKLRELRRLKRDLERQEAAEAEKAETLRRRGLTDQERRKEDAELVRLGLKKGDKAKSKLAFMQKYYHKGAFYMDDETLSKGDSSGRVDVRRKDYNDVTGEWDRFDIASMPKAMQVRAGKFGMAGQTKYTHLTDQDTTTDDRGHKIGQNSFGWMQGARLQSKISRYTRKLGGVHGDLDEAGRVRKRSKHR